MKKFLALAALTAVSVFPSFAQTVATWTFETSAFTSVTNTGSTPLSTSIAPEVGSGSATGFHTSTATVWSSPTGNGSAKSLSANNWSVGDYFQFQVSTIGFSGLSLSYDQTGSSTGPRDFALSYSLNGTTFTSIGSTYSVLLNGAPQTAWNSGASSSVFTLSYDLGAFSDINNASSVTFRITDMTTTSIGGGTTASAGTDRVDNFSVFTTPVPEPSSVVLGIAGGLAGLIIWKRRK